MQPYRRLAHRIRAIWRAPSSRALPPEYIPIIDHERLESLRAELATVRKEAACRQRIGNVIARYFIKGERTPDIAIPIDAVTIDCDPVWVPGMLERPDLTEPEFAMFRFFDANDDTVLDIGANFGYSAATMWAAGSRSRILSFEPNQWHSVCLEQIKALRPGQFDYLITGLGNAETRIPFTMPVVEGTGISGLSSAAIESETDWAIPENLLSYMMNYLPNIPLPRLQFSETLWPISKLDDVLARNRFAVPLDRISAIKIDVEGYEADVLAGAGATLDRHRPMLMIEGANRVPEVVSQLVARDYAYADFRDEGVVLSDEPSTRVGGFFLHRTKLDAYRRIGLLLN
ncbi:MAG: FkbM family methyltransferase [Mycobacterium sp.]|nr:FkbM family methyltransferase [Mycobacterium sp.]